MDNPINIDPSLREKMSQYDVDWSEICRQAIENKIGNLNNNSIENLIDIDIPISNTEIQKVDVPKFPREIYQLLKKVWQEYFTFSNYPKSKVPTSTEIKQLWKTWYSTADDDDWYERWENNERQELENSVQKAYSTGKYSFADEQNEFLLNFDDEIENHGHEPTYTEFVQFISRFLWDGQLLNIYDLNPLYLQSVNFEEKDDLPESSGIYFVIDESKIYYIGMSVNINRRWYEYHKQKQLESIPNLRISYIVYLPKYYLKNIESTFIKHFTPCLNIRENPLYMKAFN